jgi:hypothetical protein
MFLLFLTDSTKTNDMIGHYWNMNECGEVISVLLGLQMTNMAVRKTEATVVQTGCQTRSHAACATSRSAIHPCSPGAVPFPAARSPRATEAGQARRDTLHRVGSAPLHMATAISALVAGTSAAERTCTPRPVVAVAAPGVGVGFLPVWARPAARGCRPATGGSCVRSRG